MTHITPDEIERGSQTPGFLKQCALDMGVAVEDLRGYSREQPLARYRQLVMWKMRQAGFSYTQIGRSLRRDHTTAIYGTRRIQEIMDRGEL